MQETVSIGKRKKKGEVSVCPEDFEFVALAGRGGFGNVWVVRKKNDFCGKVMAMKITNKSEMKVRQYAEHIVHEKEIMATVHQHPFIVDLYFTFQTQNNVYIVMEYLPGGHLLSYVMETDDPWPDDRCRFYGAEILLALEHMHKLNVVYRDLKLENILLDIDGHIRLTDFGLSYQLKDENDRVYSMSGTAAYIAPELLAENGEKGHGKSVDIWAFGVMMFILLLHESPFYSENTFELFEKIQKEEIDWELYQDDLSPNAFSLLQGLLTKKVEKRLGCGPKGIKEIIEHPFFQPTDWDALLKLQVVPMIKPKLRVAERATAKDKMEQNDPALHIEDKSDIFSGFSFVAEHYIQLLQNEENVRSFHRVEESVCWPLPIFALPISVANRIISNLSIEDIGRASLVCKDWNEFLWSNLRTINLSSINPNLFAKYFTSRIVKVITRSSRLTILQLNPGLKDAFVSNIPQIGGLKSLSFAGCTNLTALGLQRLYFSVGFSKQEEKRKITQRFPILRRLDLSFCVNIGDSGLEFIAGFTTLIHLQLTGVSTITDAGIRAILLLKSLQTLELQGLTKITDAGIMQLSALHNLYRLDLTGCTGLTQFVVEELSKKIEYVTWTTDPFDPAEYNSFSPLESPNKKKKTNIAIFKNIKGRKDVRSPEKEREKDKDKDKSFNVKLPFNLKKKSVTHSHSILKK